MKNHGIIGAIIAACLWAVSGISGQILLADYHFSVISLMSIRLTLAGIILLVIAYGNDKGAIFNPLRNKRDGKALVIFSLIGMLAVQYTYFQAISYSNVAYATVIQYAAPFFIVIYESFKSRRVPTLSTHLLMLSTFAGVLLLATKGNLANLNASAFALFWGVLSAMSLAFYSIYPVRLLKTHGSLTIVGWAMLLGSIPMNILQPFWQINQDLNSMVLIQLVIVVLLGTALAYYLYMDSLKHIPSALASFLTAFEPGSATALSIIIFHQTFSMAEIFGCVIIILSIILLHQRL